MQIDKLNEFTSGLDTAGNDGVAFSDILDWGTDGNGLGTIPGAGDHGDDVMRLLS